MKLIPLTKGKFAKVDDADYDWLMQWKWLFDGQYASRTGKLNEGRKHISMHRQIMGTMGTNILTDHKDRDKLNCQRDNLRIATHSENMRNRAAYGFSKLCGVSFEADRNKWRGGIFVNGVRIRKRFDTEIEAAKWRNEMAIKYFGEFASINQL